MANYGHLSPVLEDKFISDVKHAYQQMTSKMFTRVNVYRDVGENFRFPTAGKVDAYTGKAAGADLTTVNGATARIPARPIDVRAAVLIPDIVQVATNVDTLAVETKRVAAAIWRKLDELAFDKLNAGVDAGNISAVSISNALNRAGVIAIDKALTINDVPFENRYGIVSPGGREDIVADTTLSNINDFGNISQAVYGGEYFPVMGFEFCTHTGLSIPSSAQRRNWFFQKDAIALAMTADLTVNIKYIDMKDEWLVAAKLMADFAVVDPKGVVYADIAD